MADWNKIKIEYVTTKISLRALAEKYEINLATIGKKASAENWVKQRKQKENQKQTKTINKIIEHQAKQQAKEILTIETLANELLEKAKLATEQLTKTELVETTRDKLIGTNAQGQTIERHKEEKSLKIVDGNIKVPNLKALTDILVNLDKLKQNGKVEQQTEVDPLSQGLQDLAKEL